MARLLLLAGDAFGVNTHTHTYKVCLTRTPPQARFRYQVPLHLMSFAAIVKVCPPRLCVADGPVDMSPCWDMVVYGWQLSMGLCATLALLYAWESMMRLTFLCNHAVGVASGRRVVAEPTSQQGRA